MSRFLQVLFFLVESDGAYFLSCIIISLSRERAPLFFASTRPLLFTAAAIFIKHQLFNFHKFHKRRNSP